MRLKKKKKKKGYRVTKKDKEVHRKLIRRDKEEREQSAGIRFDRERYLIAVANIKRKLVNIDTDLIFLLANAGECIDRKRDLEYAREYVQGARQQLGYTEFISTDVGPDGLEREVRKTKLNRRKKRKLNRRKSV